MCYDVPTKIEKGRSAMFVLLDIEWIEGRGGHRSLTQLYAARVDEKWNTIRAERDSLLMQSDWSQMEDAPVNKAAWAAYRQQLRDLPQNQADPFNIEWPQKP